jgi:hypothetical protein
MNANQPEKLVPPTDRNHATSAGDPANSGELAAGFGIASPQVTAVAFVMLILSGFSAPRCGAKVCDSDGSEANVRALHNAAHDGDTITLPAGTFSWTSRLDITKGITLQGATTINGAGTSNPTVTDATIIKDDTPRTGNVSGIIKVTCSVGQFFRMTGITFRSGALTTNIPGGAINLSTTDGNAAVQMRIDHCHFDQLYAGRVCWVTGWVYGVWDHNAMDIRGTTFPFHVNMRNYGGNNQINGNGSWADYPWYGTEKFFFIEDNTIKRINAAVVAPLIDGDNGGRWVIRHNYIENADPQGHGTEGGAYRGQRANEFYDNIVNNTVKWNGGGQRGGTSMWHDNVFLGYEPPKLAALANYRTTWIRPNTVWGISDGTSVWDRNDTEGNGTYVEGHPPFLFESGSATSANVVNGSQSTFTDSTKNWTPDQWKGYSIRNTNPAIDLGAYIISNTSNTITYWWGKAADSLRPATAKTKNRQMIFNAGDTYEIHRVLTVMDGCGMGKGDQVNGARHHPAAHASPPTTGKGHQVRGARQPAHASPPTTGKGDQARGARQPINTTVGRPFWTHEATEPCYSWNNVYSPNGHVLGFRGSGPPLLPPRENIEYFNLGGGFPADTTPSQVRSRYAAALNGVDYTGTFVYPHPLVTGAPTPTPSATPSFSRHLSKKEKQTQKRVKKSNQAWIRGSLKRDRE